MSIDDLVNEIRKLVREAETAKALETLSAFLKRDEKYAELWNATLIYSSRYKRLQNAHNLHTITREEFDTGLNKLDKNLLEICNRLAKRRLDAEGLCEPGQMPKGRTKG